MSTPTRSGLNCHLVVATLLLALLGIAQVESHLHGHGHGHDTVVELSGHRKLGALSEGVTRVASLTDEAGPWNSFKTLLDTKLGDVRTGVGALKSYLQQFGYISKTDAPAGTPFTDTFDNITQTAVMNYQRSFGLTVTGRLDVATLTQMITPRCGREDVINGTLIMLQRGLTATGTQHVSVGSQKWASFAGNPRWTRKNLTYAIDSTLLSPAVTQTDTEIAIDTAFAQWSAVTNLTFTRIQSLTTADITISFDLLDHGDGNPFDGQLGVLAHAYAPTNGRLHFDNSESWSINIQSASSTLKDFDLVSVAVHEIGHLIGLEHSSVPDAIMYPSISPLSSKQALNADDIAGAQSLYGANPTFTPGTTTPGTGGNLGAAVASWRRLRAMDVALSCFGLLVASLFI
ncbi:hypothetical protein KC19_12G080700 [Ceratodon purpureus]|uniref:Peptidase metallopeptidase domain-containing protein n=1 Tax=Ceratodon purpureus TaxID=3225 RepID=A0A8T0G8T0_CERPU|nr:hypothetical protein KC19_12G080700 [Ceratodon purpureus]